MQPDPVVRPAPVAAGTQQPRAHRRPMPQVLPLQHATWLSPQQNPRASQAAPPRQSLTAEQRGAQTGLPVSEVPIFSQTYSGRVQGSPAVGQLLMHVLSMP